MYLEQSQITSLASRAKGKLLEYSDLEMSEYLTPLDQDISINERNGYFSVE